jgi:hypothetical protein
MSDKLFRIRGRLAVFVILVPLLCGCAIALTQAKSSLFYSRYDAREIVRREKYKGIDCAAEGMGAESESEIAEVPRDGRAENTKSLTYGCRVQTAGDDKFNLTDFLNWLVEKTIKQIENGGGKVLKQKIKSGKRFSIEYTEKDFTGRVEVDGDMTGGNLLSLDVEITESSGK